eukprot:NODE_422_length_8880_cov_0.172759.p1 type:complete len:268 gc:universal NODE_422_length_8880_cov_0.172759:8332-7529(-)
MLNEFQIEKEFSSVSMIPTATEIIKLWNDMDIKKFSDVNPVPVFSIHVEPREEFIEGWKAETTFPEYYQEFFIMKHLTEFNIWVKLVQNLDKWRLVVKKVCSRGSGIYYDEINTNLDVNIDKCAIYAKMLCKRFIFKSPTAKDVRMYWDDTMYIGGSRHSTLTFKSVNNMALKQFEHLKEKRSKVIEYLYREDTNHYDGLVRLGVILPEVKCSTLEMLIPFRHPLYFQFVDKYDETRKILSTINKKFKDLPNDHVDLLYGTFKTPLD